MGSSRFRRWVLAFHLWSGLLLGSWLVLLGLTGSALVFYVDLEQSLAPIPVQQQAVRAARPAEIEAALRLHFPRYDGPWRIELPMSPAAPIHARYYGAPERKGQHFAPFMASLDPATLALREARFWGDTPLTWIYNLHFTLLLGKGGATAVGVIGLLNVALLLAGIYLWWPSPQRWWSGLRILPRSGTVKRAYDLHCTGGVYGLLLLLALLLTGSALAFPDQTRTLLGAAPPAPAPTTPAAAPPALAAAPARPASSAVPSATAQALREASAVPPAAAPALPAASAAQPAVAPAQPAPSTASPAAAPTLPAASTAPPTAAPTLPAASAAQPAVAPAQPAASTASPAAAPALPAASAAPAATAPALRAATAAPSAIVSGLPVAPGASTALDDAVRQALLAFPHAELRWIETSGARGTPIMLRLHQPFEPSRRFPQTRTWHDPSNGQVLRRSDPAQASIAQQITYWMHPLHNGEAFGQTGRWIVFACGFLPLLLFVTGVVRWQHKRTARTTVLHQRTKLHPPPSAPKATGRAGAA